MISFDEAYKLVLESCQTYGSETISIEESLGRILDEDIKADRDFPPFNRVTKDGIALKYSALSTGLKSFKIQEIAAAGDVQKTLINDSDCIEVMTGAMLPNNTDTVIMYEETIQENGIVHVNAIAREGQNIHIKGNDRGKNEVLVSKNSKIDTSTIGILATVGRSKIKVKKLPKVAIVSTGNELVGIDTIPKPHEIRSSNNISLNVLLKKEHISSDIFHIRDDAHKISEKLVEVFRDYDILMMSGGVSMGKFDLIPEILEKLGAKKIFHKVAQRPGKPFWFGKHEASNTLIFSFPGNPVSTYVNYHVYFLPWLVQSLSQDVHPYSAIMEMDYNWDVNLTRFALVRKSEKHGRSIVELIGNNGSGDLVSLNDANGVITIPPNTKLNKGDVVEYIPF